MAGRLPRLRAVVGDLGRKVEIHSGHARGPAPFASQLRADDPRVRVGDLSATLISRINPLANLFRVPDKKTALMPDWETKLPALVRASSHADITNLSGVPSWFLTVIKEVMKARDAERICDVWPNLEVFFHGGKSFDPYRRSTVA